MKHRHQPSQLLACLPALLSLSSSSSSLLPTEVVLLLNQSLGIVVHSPITIKQMDHDCTKLSVPSLHKIPSSLLSSRSHHYSACPSFNNISNTICPPGTSGWLMQILTVPLESCCAPAGGCSPAKPAPPPPMPPAAVPVGPR